MIDACELSPSWIRGIAPYVPGKPSSELAREMGLDERDIVKLASNENPLGPGPAALAAMQAALLDIARYPDGNGFDMKRALAAHYKVDAAQLVLGNGSNDVLELAGLSGETGLREAFGDDVIDHYHHACEWEISETDRVVTDFEIQRLLERA